MNKLVTVGEKAPDFALIDQNNNMIKLKDLRGRKVILYFYPKDDSPGCTCEAQEFTKFKSHFLELNTVIIGISADNVKSHKAFASKYNINFSLGSDTDTLTCRAYNVWGKRTYYEGMPINIKRTTFFIDEDGYIRYMWEDVQEEGHAYIVLKFLQEY